MRYLTGEDVTAAGPLAPDVLVLDDCLRALRAIPDNSVDMVLADLPYGTTACKWDVVIPFEPMWSEIWRVVRPDGAVCLFGSEPFSTHLRMSAIDHYRYDWYWDKKFGGNFVQAKRMPLKSVETISVFAKHQALPRYFPIMTDRAAPIVQGGTKTAAAIPVKNRAETHTKRVYDKKYPVTLLPYPKELGRTQHPTQKPVELRDYLMRTHTLAGETVLDFCMGSGSTGVASLRAKRQFIGIEKDPDYFEIARSSLRDEV